MTRGNDCAMNGNITDTIPPVPRVVAKALPNLNVLVLEMSMCFLCSAMVVAAGMGWLQPAWARGWYKHCTGERDEAMEGGRA